jgi:hypothetical protein
VRELVVATVQSGAIWRLWINIPVFWTSELMLYICQAVYLYPWAARMSHFHLICFPGYRTYWQGPRPGRR